MYVFSLCAWVNAISDYFPEQEVTLKLLTSMCNRAETNKILGFLANGLLFNLRIPNDIQTHQMLDLVLDKLSNAIHYQDYGLENLYALRGLQESCAFCFNWHNYSLLPTQFDNVELNFRSDLLPESFMWHDGTIVACNVYLDDESIIGRISYVKQF